MTGKEMVLAGRLLELAANEFSNHGCNDMEDTMFASWTDQEREDFRVKVWEFEGDDEAMNEGVEVFGDMAMDYLASQLISKGRNEYS